MRARQYLHHRAHYKEHILFGTIGGQGQDGGSCPLPPADAAHDTDSLQSQLATAKSLLDCQSSRPNDIFAFRDILSSPLDALSDIASGYCFDSAFDYSIKRTNVFNSV